MHKIGEFHLDGKVCLITGASKGLGYEIAMGVARYGATVAICGRNETELDNLSTQLSNQGKEVSVHVIDITEINKIMNLVDDVINQFGRIDVLINCAGVNRLQDALDVTEKDWDAIINTNLKGLFFCAREVARVMIKQGGGRIINISSSCGTVGFPRRAAYGSSKGGVNTLTKNLAVEWAKYNINVNAIAPAFFETPLTEKQFKEDGFQKYLKQNTLLGRAGKPEEIVGAVIFLASNASSYITGHILAVDGGWTAH